MAQTMQALGMVETKGLVPLIYTRVATINGCPV